MAAEYCPIRRFQYPLGVEFGNTLGDIHLALHQKPTKAKINQALLSCRAEVIEALTREINNLAGVVVEEEALEVGAETTPALGVLNHSEFATEIPWHLCKIKKNHKDYKNGLTRADVKYKK